MQAVLDPPEVYLPPVCTCCKIRPLLRHEGVSLCGHCDCWPELLEDHP